MPLPFFIFDPTMLLLLPALALAIWAQMKVKSNYARFSRVGTRSGLTGGDVARRILRDAGIGSSHSLGFGDTTSCSVESVPGQLTDHYDPRSRTVRLSQDVYHGRSVAALGIAAHEVGHAIQHARTYSPLMVRNIIYPVCSIGSTLAFPLFVIGLLVPVTLGQTLMHAAIILFSVAVFFTVLTLPVEFNASRRALTALSNGGYLTTEELAGARKVLSAAALTYVAATAMAVLQLLRMVLLAGSRD
jgi:Zn-dependent membrane protease YugP